MAANRAAVGERYAGRLVVLVAAAVVVGGWGRVGPEPGAIRDPGPDLVVDASSILHAIPPEIYGMSFADEALAAELALPVRRFGGNSTTRYSWIYDTSNRAMDWFYENIPNSNPDPGSLPHGSASDRFVDQDRRTGALSLITLPLIGWAPKARTFDCGFRESLYGPQQEVDPWQTDCGNGIDPGGDPLVGNNPTDTSMVVDETYVTDWIAHLIGRYGTAAEGGVAFYDLDNEPMLWNDTHRDVHPEPASYDEMRDRTWLYGAAVKAADPTARTLGPVTWGWTAYLYSALDWSAGGAWWQNPQDRNAHGGIAFTPWYLRQMADYEAAHGVRILDYLDLHYYPQSDVALRPAGDAATQARRLRSTRSLWDPTYVDESWIAEPVHLIPRMRGWVQGEYPGTLLAVTEYNFGGLEHINGALAQADVLGIFGREGLHLACLWAPPDSGEPGAYAFRVYRNYDEAGAAFGETAVVATSTDQAQVSIFGSLRAADGALILVVVNKSGLPLDCALSLTGFQYQGYARVYRYDPDDLGAIVRLADLPVARAGFQAELTALSITVYEIPPRTGPSVPTLTWTGLSILLLLVGLAIVRPGTGLLGRGASLS